MDLLKKTKKESIIILNSKMCERQTDRFERLIAIDLIDCGFTYSFCRLLIKYKKREEIKNKKLMILDIFIKICFQYGMAYNA